MAIVANKGIVAPLDVPWCTPNRTTAADPNGALTPQYVGELVEDTANKKVWQATTAANSGWVTYNVGPRTA
jgi:hypothetical protein